MSPEQEGDHGLSSHEVIEGSRQPVSGSADGLDGEAERAQPLHLLVHGGPGEVRNVAYGLSREHGAGVPRELC